MPPADVSRRSFLKTGSCALFTATLLASSGATLAACDASGGIASGLTTDAAGLGFDGATLTVDLASFPDLQAVGGAIRVTDIDVIVVHAAEGDYRAFDSVCPHERNPIRVFEASGGGYQLRCPSHGWTFDLDGGPTGRANRGTSRFPLTESSGSLQVTVR